MSSQQNLIDQVRQVLIQSGGTAIKVEIYSRFVNESNALELTEIDFYKVILKPADKSINWDLEQKKNNNPVRQVEMYCPKCGNLNEEKGNYCAVCGEQLYY